VRAPSPARKVRALGNQKLQHFTFKEIARRSGRSTIRSGEGYLALLFLPFNGVTM
jgi:hypothetical protein